MPSSNPHASPGDLLAGLVVHCSDQGTLALDLRVIPNAQKNAIVGVHGQALKMRVAAAPEKGKANKAIVTFFEKADKGLSAAIIRGQSSQDKSLELKGLSESALMALLQSLMKPKP